MTTKIWIITLIIALSSSNLNAQKNSSHKKSVNDKQLNPIEGLRKAGPGDIDPNTPMMLNPMTTPMYFENLTLLKESDFMEAMMSGDYMPEPYVDNNKVVRAFVLRKASEEEKKFMITFSDLFTYISSVWHFAKYRNKST